MSILWVPSNPAFPNGFQAVGRAGGHKRAAQWVFLHDNVIDGADIQGDVILVVLELGGVCVIPVDTQVKRAEMKLNGMYCPQLGYNTTNTS